MGFVHELYRWKYVGLASLDNATIHDHFLEHEMSFLQMEHYVKLTLFAWNFQIQHDHKRGDKKPDKVNSLLNLPHFQNACPLSQPKDVWTLEWPARSTTRLVIRNLSKQTNKQTHLHLIRYNLLHHHQHQSTHSSPQA